MLLIFLRHFYIQWSLIDTCVYFYLIKWSTNRLIDWFISWTINRLAGWLIYLWINRLIDWLVDWSISWLIDRILYWIPSIWSVIGLSFDWIIDQLNYFLFGQNYRWHVWGKKTFPSAYCWSELQLIRHSWLLFADTKCETLIFLAKTQFLQSYEASWNIPCFVNIDWV